MPTQQELDRFRARLLRALYASNDVAIVSRLLANLMLIARELPDPIDRARLVARLRDEADALEAPVLREAGCAPQRGPLGL